MARSEAATKANAEQQAGYKLGLWSLETMASRLEPLPCALINLKACGPYGRSAPLDFASLLGNESTILWSDGVGFASIYDADLHAVRTVPNLKAPKGHDAISISMTRAAAGGSRVEQSHSLYVMGSKLPHNYRGSCFENLNYKGGHDVPSAYDLSRGWCSLPPPPIYELPEAIDAYTVVGGTIYVSSTRPGIGTYMPSTRRPADGGSPAPGACHSLVELSMSQSSSSGSACPLPAPSTSVLRTFLM